MNLFVYTSLILYFIALQTSVAAMETLAPILGLTGFFFAFKKRSIVFPNKALLATIAGLLITATTSYFINNIQQYSFIKYIGEFRWLLIFIGLNQLFYYYKDKINWDILLKTGQTIAILSSLYAIYQFFYGHDFFRSNALFHKLYANSPYLRPNAFFSLPTTYAHSSSMFFAFCLPFLLSQPSKTVYKKTLETVYLCLSPITIFITFTRAAWVSSLSWTLAFIYQNHRSLFKKVAVTLIAAVIFSYFGFETFQNRLNSVFDMNYDGNIHRLYLWKANWLMFLDHPLWGIGFEVDTHREIVGNYLNTFAPHTIMRSHPHSTYLNYLSGLGIFGFIFLMLFLAINIKNSFDGIQLAQTPFERCFFWGILGAQAILLIGGLTECMLEDIELNHQYVFYIAAQQAYLSHLRAKLARRESAPL